MQLKMTEDLKKKSHFGYYSKTALLSIVKKKKTVTPWAGRRLIERILYMPINLMRLSL
jgi:hypothetical protein